MASTNSLTPTQAPNTSIISPLTQDFPLENITLSYSPPPENSLANNELPDNSTSIEQLDTSTNIDIKEENRSAKTDVDALILNENPAPKIESISENNPTENSQIDPITGEIIQPENPNPTAYTSGIFTVDSTGKISIEYLSDGGSYQGELAIFSLEGLEKLVPDSPELRLEAASRALSNSPLGYIAISDITEAAKYSNLSGEENPNAGEYKGIKTFTMKPGDKIGIMLVPNGTVREVYENPNIGGDKQPLFSMATANSSDAEAAGQIASADSNGIFVMEDMPIASSDRDLNDIIFAFKGAAPQVISMDELIGSNTDWRTSEAGKKLIADAAPKSETKLDDKKTRYYFYNKSA
ncbi:MAG: DUF4114 domain-containing protein [Richelia sp. CSU_2_1]|nr:DUF4114 domain-containing protein [Microcoleus sp. SU_5_3]NJR24370.1 DUF4114 domain-containing protein [Richelia sp. CSU_2_1]